MHDPQQNAQLEKEDHLLAAHLPQPCLLGELYKQTYSVEQAVRGTKMLEEISRRFLQLGQCLPGHLSRRIDLLVKLARGSRTAISREDVLG
mgnify:CR=1 FL=1